MPLQDGGAVHGGHDQHLYFVARSGRDEVRPPRCAMGEADLSVVPSRTNHNFRNDDQGMLKLRSPYSPADHDAATGLATKAAADTKG